MKDDIIKAIDDAIALLIECDLLEKAGWFKSKSDLLKSKDEASPEFQDELKKLERILGGMGSFADLPMVPKQGSDLSEEEAEARQERIAETIYQEIKKIKNKNAQ